MTDSDRDTSDNIAFTTDISVELSNLLFINLRKSGVTVAAGINDILAQLVLVDLVGLMNGQLGDVHLVEQVILEPLIGVIHSLLLLLSDHLSRWDMRVLPHLRVIFHV